MFLTEYTFLGAPFVEICLLSDEVTNDRRLERTKYEGSWQLPKQVIENSLRLLRKAIGAILGAGLTLRRISHAAGRSIWRR